LKSDSKVFVICPTLQVGGIASVAITLHEEAVSQEFDSTLITFYSAETEIGKYEGFVCGNFVQPKSFISRLFTFCRKVLWLKSEIRLKQDAYFLCLDPSSVLLVLLASGFSVSSRVIGACFTPKELLTRGDILIIRYVFAKIRKVIVPSKHSKIQMESIDPYLKTLVVPCPLSAHAVRCSTINARSKEIDVLFMGRLSKEKNPFMVLEIAEASPDISFEIAGRGYLEESMLARITESNLQNVDMVGWKEPEDFFPRSKILLMTSEHESFGLVVVEAWLHGLKVVASELSQGPKELITSLGNGVVVKDFSKSDWGAAIAHLAHMEGEVNFERKILEEFGAFTIFGAWVD
jgi:glycosyltransferase involved in cell wall biosynthesis